MIFLPTEFEHGEHLIVNWHSVRCLSGVFLADKRKHLSSAYLSFLLFNICSEEGPFIYLPDQPSKDHDIHTLPDQIKITLPFLASTFLLQPRRNDFVGYKKYLELFLSLQNLTVLRLLCWAAVNHCRVSRLKHFNRQNEKPDEFTRTRMMVVIISIF